PVVARLGALLLVAARAERAIAHAGDADDAHLAVSPRALEAVDQLVDRARAERVHPLRPVDRDPGQAVLNLVADVFQLHLSSSLADARTLSARVGSPPCAPPSSPAPPAGLGARSRSSWRRTATRSRWQTSARMRRPRRPSRSPSRPR